MPVANLNAGRAFVWLVSGFLLSSLAIGGGFLISYLALPTSPRMTMLMDADVGGSVATSSLKFGGTTTGGSKMERASCRSVSNRNGRDAVDLSEDNDGRQVRFADAIVLEERSNGWNSMNAKSFASHESEMPLAK